MRQIAGLPRLVAGDPDDAEAEVVVHSDDVVENVVAVVVGVPPLRGEPGHVPLPRRGVDFRVVHPVPLPVRDVVTDLHVLHALGDSEGCHSENPPGPSPAGADQQPCSDIQCTLERDRAPDVGGVRRPERLGDISADLVQFGAQRLDIIRGEVRIFLDVGDRHGVLSASSSQRAR